MKNLGYDRWKLVFMEQREEGLNVWQNPLIPLRFPKLFDLRAGEYAKWRIERAFLLIPAQAYVAEHLRTYVEYPPRQRPGTFALDAVLAKLQSIGGSD